MADQQGDQKRDVEYDAPWAQNLKHRPDPNRVTSLQTPTPGHFAARPAGGGLPADPATAAPALRPPATPAAVAADPQSVPAEPSYYDVPILKPPVWTWMIPAYFYLGGLSAGSYLVGRTAERWGGERFTGAARAGAYISLAALVPCPPLLIADLGDPKRFHHMLRVFKPGSPMNLGTWAITAFSGANLFEALRQFVNARADRRGDDRDRGVGGYLNHPWIIAAHDTAGFPLAATVASYTGLLLSCTANPLWCKNGWLSPLFTASAVSTGAEAISLALDLTPLGKSDEDARDADDYDDDRPAESAAHQVLRHVDTAAHAVELGAMAGFMHQAGDKAAVLKTGRMKPVHQFAVGAVIASEVLKLLPLPRRARKPARILSAGLGLAGGFAMRWAISQGGHDAAADPHTARLASKPRTAPARPRNALSSPQPAPRPA